MPAATATRACPCGCPRAGQPAHAVAAALSVDDLDGALEAGLLDCPTCEGCTAACTTSLLAVREQRVGALAARERYRARAARLARRRDEREQRRSGPAAEAGAVPARPALPPAAAAALARAKARAAGRRDA